MYRELSGLILYSDLGENAILQKLAEIFRDFEEKTESKAPLFSQRPRLNTLRRAMKQERSDIS